MTISNLKELKALVKACRQLGIDKIKVDNVELELSSILPNVGKQHPRMGVSEEHVFVPGGIDADTKIDTPDELTDEQLLYYSAQSHEQIVES